MFTETIQLMAAIWSPVTTIEEDDPILRVQVIWQAHGSAIDQIDRKLWKCCANAQLFTHSGGYLLAEVDGGRFFSVRLPKERYSGAGLKSSPLTSIFGFLQLCHLQNDEENSIVSV